MPKLFIPWELFFESLRKQPATVRQEWLQWWLFNDPGVVLIPDILIPAAKVPGESSVSLREKQERAVLSLITNRKQSKTLH